MLRSLTLVAGLLFAANAMGAECTAPAAPAIPSGAAASLDEMKSAQADMKKYLADADDYMKCLDFKHSADADDKHDKLTQQMQKSAAAFNEQLKAFKAAHPG